MKKLALVALPLALTACADDPVLQGSSTLSLASLVENGDHLQGIARDPVNDDLHILVEGRGLLQVNRDGQLVAERLVGQKGLEDRPYRDLAVIGDGRFLLIADNEGYLYDELTESQRVHFCVEPGFFEECTDENGNWADQDGDGICDWNDPAPTEPEPAEPEPIGEPITQQNDALALAGGQILAAPRFYENDVQIEASLRTYDVGSGDPRGSVDITTLGVDLAGIDIDGETLLGASGDQLVRFNLNGEKQGEAILDISDAAGLIIEDGDALILDRDSLSVRRYDVDKL